MEIYNTKLFNDVLRALDSYREIWIYDNYGYFVPVTAFFYLNEKFSPFPPSVNLETVYNNYITIYPLYDYKRIELYVPKNISESTGDTPTPDPGPM